MNYSDRYLRQIASYSIVNMLLADLAGVRTIRHGSARSTAKSRPPAPKLLYRRGSLSHGLVT